jgi:hypothetical protein
MGSRKKDIDDLIAKAERNNCRVDDPGEGKKYKVRCGCAVRHMTYISKTPSGMTYVNRKLQAMRRWECWQQSRE